MSDRGVDLDAAREFVRALDPSTDTFTFQTFADSQDAKAHDRELREAGKKAYYARVLHGTLDEHADTLAKLNDEGAGVFVTVNTTRGAGRKGADVIAVRAYFVDLDGSPVEPVLDFRPRPHLVVETSPGRYHAYWLARGDDDLDEFTPVQKALAHAFAGDPKVIDLPRVMRVPGFAHRKHGSTPARVLHYHDDERVSADQMKTALGSAMADAGSGPAAPNVGRAIEGVPELEKLAERDCNPQPDPRNPGKWFVTCPWEHEHTARGDGTDTCFYEAHTNGYAGAAFVCQHQHCEGRGIRELRAALDIEDNSAEAVRADAHKLDKNSGADEIKAVLRRAAILEPVDREEIVQDVASATGKTRTAIKQQVQTYARRESAQDSDVIDRLNERHAVVRAGGKTAVLTEFYDRHSGQIDIKLSTPSDMRAWYANDKLPDGTTAFDAWMESSRRRQYEDIVFEPGQDTPGEYNLWRGLAVEPNPEGSCDLFLQHVHEVLCNGDEYLYEYVVAWMADAVQNPRHRPGTSLVMRGGMGVGKGIVAETLGQIFGQHYVPVRSPRYLTGNFNAHLKYALLVFADEAFWAGDKSAEGVLKGMVTEPSIFIEAKNYDQIKVPNHIRLLIASNEDWVVPAGLDERRFVVLDVNNERQSDLQWFNAVADERDNGGLGALLHYLQTLDIGGVDLRKLPKTVGTADQKLRSADPVIRWWYERLYAGSADAEDDSWPEAVRRERLYVQYQHHCEEENLRGRRLTHTQLADMVERMCASASVYRQLSGGKREWWVSLPDLVDARREFEAFMGGSPLRWPDDEDGTTAVDNRGY